MGDPRSTALSADHREQALAWAEQAGPTDWAISQRIATGNFFMEMGHYDRSRGYLDRALADSRATRNLIRVAVCQQNLAIADRNEGNLIQAKQRLDEALHIWHRVPKRPMRGHALMLLALVHLHLGLFDEARRQCAEAMDNFHLDQLRTYDGAVAAGVGLVCLQLGCFDAVDRLAGRLAAAFEGDEVKPVPFHVGVGCAAIAKGDLASAREHFLEAVGRAGVWPGVSFRLRCLHALLLVFSGGTFESLPPRAARWCRARGRRRRVNPGQGPGRRRARPARRPAGGSGGLFGLGPAGQPAGAPGPGDRGVDGGAQRPLASGSQAADREPGDGVGRLRSCE